MMQDLSADLERDYGTMGTEQWEMEGEAPAEPNERDKGQGTRKKIGLTGRFALPNGNLTPNEFGAQKFVINHWLKPVAWVVLEHILSSLGSRGCLVR